MAGIFDALGATTIINYKKGALDSVVENNPFLSMWFKDGLIERNQGGTSLTGVIEAGSFTPRVSADGDDRSGRFTAVVHDVQWSQNWAQTSIETGVNFGEIRRNYGEQALVDLADVKVPRMYKALMTNGATSFNGQLLARNSEAYTGTDGVPIDGIPTFILGASTEHTVAQAITAYDLEGFNPTTGAMSGAAPVAADKEVGVGGNSVLSPVYANVSLKYNGITGVDGVKGDAWKSTMTNSSSSAWTGTVNDQANSILVYSQYTAARCSRFASENSDYRPMFGVMTFDEHMRMGNKIGAAQTIYLKPGDESANKFGTGFKCENMIYHAGLWWYVDQSMPTGRGYVINPKMSKYRCQPILDTVERESIPSGFNTKPGDVKHTDLIESHIHFDINNLSLKCAALINGQAWFHPRYQGGWDAYVP